MALVLGFPVVTQDNSERLVSNAQPTLVNGTMEPWSLAQQEQGHPPSLPMGMKHLFPPTWKLLLGEGFLFPPLLFLLVSQTCHQRRMLWMSRTVLEVQCLRKTLPRAGPLGVLSAKEVGFQHLFAPLPSAKHRPARASCHLDLWGLSGLPGSQQHEDQGTKGYHKPWGEHPSLQSGTGTAAGRRQCCSPCCLQATELPEDTKQLSQALLSSQRLAEPSLLSPAFLSKWQSGLDRNLILRLTTQVCHLLVQVACPHWHTTIDWAWSLTESKQGS